MNSANFKTVNSYTKLFFRSLLFTFCFFAQIKVHAQIVEVGDNKEAISVPHSESRAIMPTVSAIAKPNEVAAKVKDAQILKAIRQAVQPTEPTNQIVILHTETGFVPDHVRVKKGEAYKVHVVNINIREKNVSFIMDSFTQSHNTVFGVERTFNIEPQVEGIYSYQCPETGLQGQLVVVGEEAKILKKENKRKLASEDSAQ